MIFVSLRLVDRQPSFFLKYSPSTDRTVSGMDLSSRVLCSVLQVSKPQPVFSSSRLHSWPDQAVISLTCSASRKSASRPTGENATASFWRREGDLNPRGHKDHRLCVLDSRLGLLGFGSAPYQARESRRRYSAVEQLLLSRHKDSLKDYLFGGVTLVTPHPGVRSARH